MSKKAWSQCKAKVPDIERRTQYTLYSLKQLHSLLSPPWRLNSPGPSVGITLCCENFAGD